MARGNGRRKGGALSETELQYVATAARKGRLPQEIAQHLNRSVAMVLKALARVEPDAPAADPEAAAAVTALRQTARHRQMREELSPGELAYFEEQWGAWTAQFKGDLTHADGEQLAQAIRYQVQMHRNNRRINRLERAAEDAQREADRAGEGGPPYPEEVRERVLGAEARLAEALEAKSECVAENLKLDDKYMRLMDALNTTRHARDARSESSAVSWLGVIRKLEKEEERRLLDSQMAMALKGRDAELDRLTTPLQFADGQVDLPLLSPDTAHKLTPPAAEPPERPR